MRDPVVLVPLDALPAHGRTTHLAALYGRIFGRARTPSTAWLEDRMARGAVRLGASVVAARGDPTNPADWCGLALVGLPPSLAPAARAAGMGIVPESRGRGLGKRLVEAMCRRAADAGARTLEVTAHPRHVAFYGALGFRHVRTVETWAAPATTGTPPRWSPAPPTCGGHVLATEIAETWRCGRKPRHLVCTTDGTTVTARTVEVEGGCLVAELRSDRPPSGAGPLAELRSLAGSGHVFVTGIAPDAPFRRLLPRAGFRLVQRAERMARALAPASATSDGP